MQINTLMTNFIFTVLALSFFLPTYAQKAKLHNDESLCTLHKLSKQKELNSSDFIKARNAMLIVMNEARANVSYRKRSGCKKALKLPTGLTPLVLDSKLNAAAQEQAEYQASIQQVTHDNANYKDIGERLRNSNIVTSAAEACGAGEMSNYPISYMTSETHYRPTWNLDGQIVTAVGFGIAKGADNKWYHSALWSDVKDLEDRPKTVPAIVADKTNQLKKGQRLTKGQKLYSDNKLFYATVNKEGQVAVMSAQGQELWSTKAKGEYAEMGKDGNFCLRTATNDWRWGTQITQLSKMGVTNEGYLVQLDLCNKSLWSSPTPKIKKNNPSSNTASSEVTNPANPKKSTSSCSAVKTKFSVGQKLYSKNKEYYLEIDKKGRLTVKTSIGDEVWAVGEGGTYVTYQEDGNFCLYDAKNKWKWGTGKHGGVAVGGSICLNDNGLLVQYDKNGKQLWISTKILKSKKNIGVLQPAVRLNKSEKLFSENKEYFLHINKKGRLVLSSSAGQEIWSVGKNAAYAIHQKDGHFCLYNKANKWIWGTGKHGGDIRKGSIKVENDGRLVQYDENDKEVWSSK